MIFKKVKFINHKNRKAVVPTNIVNYRVAAKLIEDKKHTVTYIMITCRAALHLKRG